MELEGRPAPANAATTESFFRNADGKKSLRVIAQLRRLPSPPKALTVEAAVRTGAPVSHPFVFRDVALPLTLVAPPPAAPAPAGIAAPQRVLVNGQPAGRGTLEIGIAARLGCTTVAARQRVSTAVRTLRESYA